MERALSRVRTILQKNIFWTTDGKRKKTGQANSELSKKNIKRGEIVKDT